MDKEDNKHCSLDLPEDREVDDCDEEVDNEDEDEIEEYDNEDEDEIEGYDNEDEDEIEEFMEDDMDKEDEKYDGTTDLSEDAEAETEAEGEAEAEADDDSSEEEFEVENFIKDGKHYSDDHPLRLMSRSCEDDKEEVGDDDDILRSCKICGVPILSCPSYTCSLGCKFFLHQPCALKFPTRFIHPTFLCIHGRHKLRIQKASTNFIYKCEDCEFVLHPLVAFPHLEIKTKHKSHPSHSLVVSHKEISCECDACGREQRGFFFCCGDCNFWIHPDCTVLPTILQFPDHPYPFILAYSLPSYYVVGRNCVICKKLVLGNHNGVYFSPQSTNAAHVTCGSMHKSASQARSNLIQLPDYDEQGTIFPSSVIHGYAANKKHFEVDDEGGRLTIQKYHKQHPLILIDGDCRKSTRINIIPCCDLCTRSINNSSSFYKCESCHFVAHKVCADILPMLEFVIPLREYADPGVELCPDPSEIIFNSIFYCIFCRRPCNGLCYYFPGANFIGLDGLPYLFIDLECMVTPSFINHASHAQHLLFRTHRLLETTTPLSCCSDYSLIYDVYRCIVCDYYIHVSCAMLPERIIFHEYDEHPLYLVFNTLFFRLSLSFTRRDTFCEVCEKDIDLNYWLYRCEMCDMSFHINCIPSIGYLSKVKFGGTTLSLPNYSHINHAYDHPLSLTRMLTVPTQRCGFCNKIIQGLVDEMAFSCEQCQFWLHFSCARDAAATPRNTKPLRLYSEIDFERLITELDMLFA